MLKTEHNQLRSLPVRFCHIAFVLCSFLLLALPLFSSGQTVFNGLLLNRLDSMPLPYALVELKETNQQAITDSLGAFTLSLPEGLKQLSLNITSVSSKTNVVYEVRNTKVEKIFVDVLANPLTEFVFKGLSARQVLEKAVAAIPQNYDTRSHFAYSFYRDYEKTNGLLTNLTEAHTVVMFKVNRHKNTLTTTDAFAVKEMRRSKYLKVISDFVESNMDEVFTDDPIYNLQQSSLEPGLFSKYKFSFDTSQKTDDYVVNYYRPDFTSESHGIGYHTFNLFYGEAIERGTITIERGSFAIKKIVRNAVINPHYDYGRPESQLNIVFPSKKYFFRFVDGVMIAEYAPENGTWHLKKIVHKYTNDFFYTGFGSLAYKITDYSEWYCDSTSRYVGADVVNEFYAKTLFPRRRYDYDKAYWSEVHHPFYFEKREDVFNHLEKIAPVEQQFIDEGKKE